MSNTEIVVTSSGGTMTFIYHDDLAPLLREGTFDVRRVSEVEPTALGEWTADLSRIGGPVLGPFALRQDALDAEVAWLRENRGL
jgi:hypothetical protein